MSYFNHALRSMVSDSSGRNWLYVPYDQLTDEFGPLAKDAPETLGIILIENRWKASRRPYHKQKLALILSNMRHFALEQARRGVAVKYLFTDRPYAQALAPLCEALGQIRVMEPAEYELRQDLQHLTDAKKLQVIPHEGWLTSVGQFWESQKDRPSAWRMDAFYRFVRQQSGILMKDGKPVGGKYSFDSENRQAWPGEPPAPNPPSFSVDPIKREVENLINKHFSHHPGRLDIRALPATKQEAQKLWQWAKEACLPTFGPYEDAMSVNSSNLFHTRISAVLNICRLLPSQVVAEVAHIPIPLASKEGFIRQVLGWREFMHHVHTVTEGFRNLPGLEVNVADRPGDGGFRLWSNTEWSAGNLPDAKDGGAEPDFLTSETPLPPAFWGQKSGLFCLDQVIASVWEEGYSHHITRLMILANLATLLDISPRQLTDWFWVAYIDAYDWVVEPNVLGMGTFAAGDLLSTKPYVSGAAYIDKMSDYCRNCAFNAKKNCPVTNLYWAFLARHKHVLQDNPRLRLIMSALQKRSEPQKTADRAIYQAVRNTLVNRQEVTPDGVASACSQRSDET
jgi:deoxyribodipyrimidine photolyase-related protein